MHEKLTEFTEERKADLSNVQKKFDYFSVH
jgi:hypothetical protein